MLGKVKKTLIAFLMLISVISFGTVANAANSSTITIKCGSVSTCKGTTSISKSGSMLTFHGTGSYTTAGYGDYMSGSRTRITPYQGSTAYVGKDSGWSGSSSPAYKSIYDAKTNVTWTNRSEFTFKTTKGVTYSGYGTATFYNGTGGGR